MNKCMFLYEYTAVMTAVSPIQMNAVVTVDICLSYS